MRRRDFVTFLGGATTWAAAAQAQESRRLIGVLGSASYGAFPGAEIAFIRGLKATGFVEGKTQVLNGAGPKVNITACRCWRANC